MRAWKERVDLIRAVDGMHRAIQTRLMGRIMRGMMMVVNGKKRIERIGVGIGERGDRDRVERAWKMWIEQYMDRVRVRTVAGQIKRRAMKRLYSRPFYAWLQEYRCRYIRRVLCPKLQLTLFWHKMKGKIEDRRDRVDRDRIVDGHRLRILTGKGMKGLREYWIEGKKDKDMDDRAREWWEKRMIRRFIDGIKKNRYLGKKKKEIVKASVKIRFRYWRERTLAQLSEDYNCAQIRKRIFKEWKNCLLAVTGSVGKFRKERVELNTIRSCFHTLKTHAKESILMRYKLLQAVTFNNFSLKRKSIDSLNSFFTNIKSKESECTKIIENRLLIRTINYWYSRTADSMEDKSERIKALAHWHALLLRKAMYGLRYNYIQCRDQYRREKEAMDEYYQRTARIIVCGLVKEVGIVKEMKARGLRRKPWDWMSVGMRSGVTRWVERARKRIAQRGIKSGGIALGSGGSSIKQGPVYSRPHTRNAESANVIENTIAQEEQLSNFLHTFQKRERLKPINPNQPTVTQPQSTLPQTQPSQSLKPPSLQPPPLENTATLESLLEEYKIKSSLLSDPTLPSSAYSRLNQDLTALKSQIKYLYSTLSTT